MEVLGRDIGEALDRMYEELANRTRTEGERELRVEGFQGALSRVDWGDAAVMIFLNEGVPTHALPHVLGVALQHVRQRLDHYPDVRRPEGRQPEGAALVRTALRELVLAPEAEAKLASLNLDQQWETEQRHEGFKSLLDGAPQEWSQPGTAGHAFAVLQYARMELQHPPQLWKSLKRRADKELPAVAQAGAEAVYQVRRFRWSSPGACFEALTNIRDSLGLKELALIEDRRTGRIQ